MCRFDDMDRKNWTMLIFWGDINSIFRSRHNTGIVSRLCKSLICFLKFFCVLSTDEQCVKSITNGLIKTVKAMYRPNGISCQCMLQTDSSLLFMLPAKHLLCIYKACAHHFLLCMMAACARSEWVRAWRPVFLCVLTFYFSGRVTALKCSKFH